MTGGQRWAAAGIATGVTAAGGLGLALSYETVRAVAADYGLPYPNAYPLGLEGGLVAILALDLLLTWRRTPIGWLRQIARLLAGATIVINATAGWISATGRADAVFAAALHALPPLLFVVVVEAARHVLLRMVAAEDMWRRDPIPRMRWILAPLPTLLLWRRMVLWQIASYEQALSADLDRREIISSLKREFGRRWHREVPADLAYRIRAGVRMDGAIQAARALLADRQNLALGVAGTVPALTDPDDDGPWNGPGNSSGNGEQEPVEPWLDDDEFARLVAGIDVPAIEEHGNENAGGEHVLGPGNNAENNPGNSVPGGGEQAGNAPGNNTVPGTENTAENNPGNSVPQTGNEPVPPAATSENTTGEHAENSVPGTGNTAGERVPEAVENSVPTLGNVVGERDPRRVLHPVPALENTAEEHALGNSAGNAGTRAREQREERGNTARGTREHADENSAGNAGTRRGERAGNSVRNTVGNGEQDSLTDEEHAQELARRIAAGEQVDLTIRGIKAACRVGAKRAGNIRALVEEHTEAVIAA